MASVNQNTAPSRQFGSADGSIRGVHYLELRQQGLLRRSASSAAQKLCIPVAHLERGIRSGDWSMPEEINRMVTDSITNGFFATR
jgi:hypothetical protein